MRYLTPMDLELFYSSEAGHPFSPIDNLQELRKTTVGITTSNVWNRIYGAKAWAQINREADVWAVLPKTTWARSGVRIITGLESTYTNLGIAETDTLPTAVAPTIVVINMKPKIMTKTFESTDVLERLAQLGVDDIFGTIDQLREFRAVDFARGLNQALMKDVEAEAAAASGNYSEGKLIQTLDRLISSDSEEDAFGGSYSGYYDWYDIDRDSATTYGDCYVSHNSGTDRSLTDELIRDAMANARKKGGHTNVMITGWDTYAKIQGIYQSYMRYGWLKETRVQYTLNGVKTAEGTEVGIQVPSIHGVPIIMSQDVPVDTISRIYLLDTTDPEGYGEPRIGISVLRPIEYFETNDYILLNKYVVKGAYRFVGELFGRFFPGQAKIRDLK